MPKMNYKTSFLRSVLSRRHCILLDQKPHFLSFRTITKMSNPTEIDDLLDFEPFEDEAKDTPTGAEDAELDLQHLTLVEDEAKSKVTESVAGSEPGILGDSAKIKPPVALQENDLIVPQLDEYIKRLVEEKIGQNEERSEARIKDAESKILAIRDEMLMQTCK